MFNAKWKAQMEYTGFAMGVGSAFLIGTGPREWIEQRFIHMVGNNPYWASAKLEMRQAVAGDYVESIIERDARLECNL